MEYTIQIKQEDGTMADYPIHVDNPVATTDTVGTIKPDGITTAVDETGTLSSKTAPTVKSHSNGVLEIENTVPSGNTEVVKSKDVGFVRENAGKLEYALYTAPEVWKEIGGGGGGDTGATVINAQIPITGGLLGNQITRLKGCTEEDSALLQKLFDDRPSDRTAVYTAFIDALTPVVDSKTVHVNGYTTFTNSGYGCLLASEEIDTNTGATTPKTYLTAQFVNKSISGSDDGGIGFLNELTGTIVQFESGNVTFIVTKFPTK